MQVFIKFGQLSKHDIGAVFNNDAGLYVGTALLCRSTGHTNISLNKRDFKFASKCCQYIYCQNIENDVSVIPMPEAIELFKRGRDFGEYVVVEWFQIKNPSNVYELPFDE